MKKIILFVLVITIAISMLLVGTSCKTTAVETTTAGETAAETTAVVETTAVAEEPIELVFLSIEAEGDKATEVLKTAIEDFNNDNEYNATVTPIWAGLEVPAKLQAMLQSGEPPDIFQYSPELISEMLVPDGLAVPLDDFMANTNAYKEEVKIKDLFVTGLLENLCKDKDGTIYTFPMRWYPQVFWYNKAYARELGVISGEGDPIAADGMIPDTWPKFMELCDYLKGKGVAPIVADAGINYYTLSYFGYFCDRIMGMGALREAVENDPTGAKIDDPGFLEAAKCVETIAQNDWVIEGADGYQWPAGQIDWANGAGFMLLLHTFMPQQVAEVVAERDWEWGAFPFPSNEGWEGSRFDLDALANGAAILTNCPNKDAAFNFLLRTMTAEYQSKYSQEVLQLACRQGIPAPEIFKDLEKILANQTGTFRTYGMTPQALPSEYNAKVMLPLDDELFLGKISAEDFIKQWKEQHIAFYAAAQ